MASRTVPITLVSGFSGAGKSTLIANLERSLRSRRLAVLNGDIGGDIGGDADGDIFTRIEEVVEKDGADLIVIEMFCHEEPFFLAELLLNGDVDSPAPRGIRIDTAVTVVDATRFFDQIFKSADLTDAIEDCEPDDDRSVAEVVLEQIEFADVLILNKIDLSHPTLVDKVEALLGRLNPRAKILRARHGQVPSSEVIGTGLFDFQETDEGAGWLSELNGEFEGVETGGGIRSFTYLEHRPLHPRRFNELLDDFVVEGLVRAKGSVWVATRHHEIGVWSLAGRDSMLSYGGAWFASTPARQWPQDERERAEIMREWVAPFGDRRQEIAFIGFDLDEAKIRARLNQCLLTADEMKDGPDSWYTIPDPLPDWHVEDDVEL